jgi:hypothetical protein
MWYWVLWVLWVVIECCDVVFGWRKRGKCWLVQGCNLLGQLDGGLFLFGQTWLGGSPRWAVVVCRWIWFAVVVTFFEFRGALKSKVLVKGRPA